MYMKFDKKFTSKNLNKVNKEKFTEMTKKKEKFVKIKNRIDMDDGFYFAMINNKISLLKTTNGGNNLIFANRYNNKQGKNYYNKSYIWDNQKLSYVPDLKANENGETFTFEVMRISFFQEGNKKFIYLIDNIKEGAVGVPQGRNGEIKKFIVNTEKVKPGVYETELTVPGHFKIYDHDDKNYIDIDHDSSKKYEENPSVKNTTYQENNRYFWNELFGLYISSNRISTILIEKKDEKFIVKDKIKNGDIVTFKNKELINSKKKVKGPDGFYNKIVFTLPNELKFIYHFRVENDRTEIILKNNAKEFGNRFYQWDEDMNCYKNDKSILFFFENGLNLLAEFYNKKDMSMNLLEGEVMKSKISEILTDGNYYDKNSDRYFKMNYGKVQLQVEPGSESKKIYFYNKHFGGYTSISDNGDTFVVFEKTAMPEEYLMKSYINSAKPYKGHLISKSSEKKKVGILKYLIFILFTLIVLNLIRKVYNLRKQGLDINFLS